MTTEQIIDTKFKDRAAGKEAGDLLFSHNVAIEVLDECQKIKGVILGLDFWQVVGDTVKEVNSADYSNLSEGPSAAELTVEEAKSLIQDKLPDNADYVSFVFK